MRLLTLLGFLSLQLTSFEKGCVREHFKEIYGLLCLYGESSHAVFREFFSTDHPHYLVS